MNNPKLWIVVACALAALPVVWLDDFLGQKPLEEQTALAVFEPAPDFALPPLAGGTPVALEAFRGDYVLLNVWASWCAPCLQEFPDLIALAAEHPEQMHLLTITIDDTQQAATEFLQRFEPTPTQARITHLWDADKRVTQNVLHILRYPESILIDPEGRMVRKFAGALTEKQLEEIRNRLETPDHAG